jgi:hypothetical protein
MCENEYRFTDKKFLLQTCYKCLTSRKRWCIIRSELEERLDEKAPPPPIIYSAKSPCGNAGAFGFPAARG